MKIAANPAEREALVTLAMETAKFLAPSIEQREVGLTQLRSIGDACREAIVPAEIRALIEYQRGKGVERNRTKGWAYTPPGGECPAVVVLKAMTKALAPYEQADEATQLQILALFFGYVYRAAVALQGERGNQR